MKKIYQSTTFMSLVTILDIDGVGVHVSFKGGKLQPYRTNGTYATSDPAIMKALENHERYGQSFVLIKTVDDTTHIVQEKTVAPTDAPTVASPEETETKPNGVISVGEVKNCQDAKLYLNKHFEVPFSRLGNTQKVMNEAKIANLTFPNWNQ